MKASDIVNQILFDYEELGQEKTTELSRQLANKILRWLAANHPDNRTRKIFLTLTNVEIGEGTVINSNFIVSDGYLALLKIGKRVAISPNVTVICQSAPNNSSLQSNEYVTEHLICEKQVTIGDDVWIGAGAIILPGSHIGEKSIIGAGAVIPKDVPAGSIVAGIPAKVIREI